MRTKDVLIQNGCILEKIRLPGQNGFAALKCKLEKSKSSVKIKTTKVNSKNGSLTESQDAAKSYSVQLEKLKNDEFIRLMQKNPPVEYIWREFIKRFQPFIAKKILKECIRLSYVDGLHKVEDFLHEVYKRLLMNDCRALKNFKGEYENSILDYLRKIAVNIVKTEFDRYLFQKRIITNDHFNNGRKWQIHSERHNDLEQILGDPNWDTKIRQNDLVEEIEYWLPKIVERSRKPDRNLLIYKYYLYGGFKAKEITTFHEFNIKTKTIFHIIEGINKELGSLLKR